MDGNGNPVTWRELNLALKPLQDGFDSVDGKVDEILLKLAHQDGVHDGTRETRHGWLETKWRLVAVVGMLVTSSVATTAYTLITRSHT